MNDCSIIYKNAKVQLDYHRRLTDTYKAAVEETKSKHDRLLAVVSYKETVRKLKQEEAWLKVTQQEDFSSEIDKTLQAYTAKLDTLKSAYGSQSSMEEHFKKSMDLISEEINQHRLNLNLDQEKYETARKDLAIKNELYQNSVRNFNKIKSKKERLLADVEQMEKDIAERTDT